MFNVTIVRSEKWFFQKNLAQKTIRIMTNSGDAAVRNL